MGQLSDCVVLLLFTRLPADMDMPGEREHPVAGMDRCHSAQSERASATASLPAKSATERGIAPNKTDLQTGTDVFIVFLLCTLFDSRGARPRTFAIASYVPA